MRAKNRVGLVRETGESGRAGIREPCLDGGQSSSVGEAAFERTQHLMVRRERAPEDQGGAE